MDSLRETQLLGISLLEIQKVEFALYGVVSHLTHLPEGRGWKFNGLSPENFLRGDPEQLKATLGQLDKAFGSLLKISCDRFKELIENRNIIAHNYWRMSRKGIRGARTLENPEAFLLEFIEQCQYWKKVINGLLYAFMLAAAKESGRESEVILDSMQTEELKTYLNHVQNT